MKPYYSKSPSTGVSTGVKGYEYGDSYITIHFTKGTAYTYTVDSCGAHHIETMKHLADAQRGLNTYVTRSKPPHASKR